MGTNVTNGNLAGTWFLHTAGHTPTGWWDQLHRGRIKTDERHRDVVIMVTVTAGQVENMTLKPAQSTANKTRTLNLAKLPLTSNISIMLLLKSGLLLAM